ncbi:MAG: hypothetical protein JWQ38_926, partial [Flavipsychrobacter sp.]|nr:hypothetical protein [Flavipsychrobacter sp.]
MTSVFFRKIAATCILLLSAYISVAADGKDKLEKLMKFYADHDHFNGTVLVMRKGTNLLVKGYGYQNIEKKIPNDEKTVFQIGDVSMQFTSELLLLLDSQGKLGHGDKVSKYIKTFPNGNKIILKNLLTHTSGLYDYTSDTAIMNNLTRPISLDKLMAVIENRPTAFEPGEKYQFTNTNYVVLGYIIERLTRWGLEDQIKTKIFQPCGMYHSGFNFTDLVNVHKATGYYKGDNGAVTPAPITDSSLNYGGKAMYTTVDDLAKWHRALSAYTLIPEDWQDVAFVPLKYNYASGWEINHMFQRKIEEQGGQVSGFSSYILRQPNDDMLVVLLQNKMVPVADNKVIAHNIVKCLYDPNYKVPASDEVAAEVAADKRATELAMQEQDRADSTKAALKKLEPVEEPKKVVEKIEPWMPLIGEYEVD